MTDQDLKDLVAGLAISQARTDEHIQELKASQAKTDAQLAKTDAQLAKTDAQLAKTDAQLAVNGFRGSDGSIVASRIAMPLSDDEMTLRGHINRIESNGYWIENQKTKLLTLILH